MSTNDDPRPRTKEILVETIGALRGDDTLAGLLYESAPALPVDRQRIHESWGGPEETPGVEMVVEPIASGSDWHGGPRAETIQLQCSVVATESWRDGHGVLAMHEIRDRCKAVLESPVAESVYPSGGGGRESPIETPDESNRLMLPLTASAKTHWMV